MVQLYFLSICLNIFGGLILAAPHFSERFPALSGIREYVYSINILKYGVMVLLPLIGIMKLISVYTGDVVVVGDLLPALTLIAAGFTMIVEHLSEKSESENRFLKKMDKIFVRYESITGVAALVAGVLHFIFPSVLFL
ncbi:MAG: hypothetical protein L3J12_01915 [Spirochaetales bacterium]|nr:hypothetical protein [Spirochaetales bacterium]